MKSVVTIITPTTGKPSLRKLIQTIEEQQIPCTHVTLWDDKRCNNEDYVGPYNSIAYDSKNIIKNPIIIGGSTVNGVAFGSALRAIGLMAAQTEFVTFADDDVFWKPNHLKTMLDTIGNANWAITKREIWAPETEDKDIEYIGIDNFESVGEEAKTPYKMVDNNCMLFRRRFGTSAAVLYRETSEYNDDRLFYNFMKQYAGNYEKTNAATIGQVCPARLVNFFKNNCTK